MEISENSQRAKAKAKIATLALILILKTGIAAGTIRKIRNATIANSRAILRTNIISYINTYVLRIGSPAIPNYYQLRNKKIQTES